MKDQTKYTVCSCESANTNDAGNIIRFNAIGDFADEVFATWTPDDGVTWYATDHQLTPFAEVHASGVVTTIAFDTYGKIAPGYNAATSGLGFQGRPVDEVSELQWFRSRHYDPSSGTFATPDPLNMASGDLNLHRGGFAGVRPCVRCSQAIRWVH